MLENHSDNSSGPMPENSSAFSQTEHRLVAAYLIVAGMSVGLFLHRDERGSLLFMGMSMGLFLGMNMSLFAFGVISILSNIVVLGIFIKYKELQTRTNAIIINLAFTDIGVSSIGYPMSAASDLHGSWRFGYARCQVYAGLNIFFGMASIGLLTLVAVDRYLTLCHPDTGRSMTTNNYVCLILGAWINGFFWALMPILGWASYAPDPTGATCTINWRKNDISFVSYTMTVVAVNFIMPLTVMAYCYYHVIRSMHNGPGHLDGDWSSQVDVTKMSVIMILAFLAAWTPYSIMCFWASFGDPKKIPPSMAIIAPLFAKSSTFYNPCIYVVANKKFRRAMFTMLTCQAPQAMPATSILPMDGAQSPQLLEQTEMRAEVYLNVAIC